LAGPGQLFALTAGVVFDRSGVYVKIEIFPEAEAAARAAASFIAAEARVAIAARGRFIAALSGGKTPALMFRALAREEVQWEAVHFVQVDERVAPAEHPDRNLTHLRNNLLPHTSLRPEHIHAMRVEAENLEAAAAQYAGILTGLAGAPPVLDLVHLGLGADGHTASLVPGDPVLNVTEADVAITGVYQGRRRMTLTYPILNRARRVLWLITGEEKASAFHRLQAKDPSIPAGRIQHDAAIVFADRAAKEPS
jgi:6-phosphogluconolactonase